MVGHPDDKFYDTPSMCESEKQIDLKPREYAQTKVDGKRAPFHVAFAPKGSELPPPRTWIDRVIDFLGTLIVVTFMAGFGALVAFLSAGDKWAGIAWAWALASAMAVVALVIDRRQRLGRRRGRRQSQKRGSALTKSDY